MPPRFRCGASTTARALAALIAVSGGPSLSRAGDSGWVLEHFGSDVTVLRSRGPGVLLSCEGAQSRFRLALPEGGAAALASGRSGWALIRPSGMREPAVVARYALAGERTLLVSGTAPADSVLAIGRLLARRPGGLDLLIRPDGRPASLGRLAALHLPLPAGPGDAAAFADFLASCASDR